MDIHPSAAILHLSDNLARIFRQPLSCNPVVMRRRFMHASAVYILLLPPERPPIITYVPVMLELLVRSDHLSLTNPKGGNVINEINGNSVPEKERDEYRNRGQKFNRLLNFNLKVEDKS